MRALLASLFLLALAIPAGARETVLRWDSGTKASHRSCAGTGHVIAFTAPRGTWWIKSVRVFGARYGGRYDPSLTPFTLAVLDESMAALGTTKPAYDRFRMGHFDWVDLPLSTPIRAPKKFRVCVAFAPTRTRGVYMGIARTKDSHSYFGLPGGAARPAGESVEWMIRVVLSSTKPKFPKRPPEKKVDYGKDFTFLEKTVRARFPALEKKGVDWKAVCREWRLRFKAAKSHREHLLNVHRLLATLSDSHTGVTHSKAGEHVPAFDGMYGAGLWIAADRGRLILRALVPGHPLAAKLPPGSELTGIDGRPAKVVHEETRARMRLWHGWSSTHFLDARLSFQFFLFGSKQRLPATFRRPDGRTTKVMLTRWGPGGRGLSRQAVTMPEGIDAKGRAVSGRIAGEIGYVRILGGMDEKTRVEFFAALDALKGVKGIILDARGMGGGSDSSAWAMAGRFFPKRTMHGRVALEPTGDWQFEGPVVMLIDERMISSAETFTWAMTETGRAVSVGRPTGGATIIPRVFEAPSGLFTFRMGVTDRKTPGRGVQPEGIGTKPDIFVPYDAPLLAGGADPVLFVARDVLVRLLEGRPRKRILAAWNEVLSEGPESREAASKDVGKLLE